MRIKIFFLIIAAGVSTVMAEGICKFKTLAAAREFGWRAKKAQKSYTKLELPHEFFMMTKISTWASAVRKKSDNLLRLAAEQFGTTTRLKYILTAIMIKNRFSRSLSMPKEKRWN